MMSLKLAQNISSYICHELANSIGVLDGNIEFLGTDNPYQEDAIDLIKHASKHSVARLRYLRTLYGTKQTPSRIQEIINLAAQILSDTHSALHFDSPEFQDAYLEAIDEKLLLAFIYIAHSDMPYGGDIEAKITLTDSGYKIKISSISDKIKTKNNLYQILNDTNVGDNISPTNAIAHYVKYLTQGAQKYKILINSGKIDYAFNAKIL
jgi:hypothetical protein